MIAIFVYNLTKVWFRHVWPEIRVPPEEGREEESRLDVDRWTYLHPQLMTLTELRLVISNLMNTSELYLQNLLAIRRERPVAFCSVICFSLSCTAFIGNRICGSTLIFSIATALVTAPGIYLYLLPRSAKDYLKRRISSLNFQTTSVEPQSEQESTPPQSPPTTTTSSAVPHLTLFDHLRRRSFLTYREPSESTEETTNLKAQLNATALIDNIQLRSDQVRSDQQINEAMEDNSSSADGKLSQVSRRNSDDLSSNESASLIGSSEDDQHDGFVML